MVPQGGRAGDADAQFNLALMYDNGQGVPKDYKEAVKWYTKSAEQEDAESQYNLGLMYYNGEGVPQDYKEAVKWYTKAAEQRLPESQYNLGLMYYDGNGVPQGLQGSGQVDHQGRRAGVCQGSLQPWGDVRKWRRCS